MAKGPADFLQHFPGWGRERAGQVAETKLRPPPSARPPTAKQVQVRVDRLHGLIPAYRVSQLGGAALRPSALYVEACLCAGGEVLGIPFRTEAAEASAAGATWDTWLTFPVKARAGAVRRRTSRGLPAGGRRLAAAVPLPAASAPLRASIAPCQPLLGRRPESNPSLKKQSEE